MYLITFLICSSAPQPILGGRSFSVYQLSEENLSKHYACIHVHVPVYSARNI